ncbi:MAG: HAD-IIIA family hydrolase [Bacteroidales bacterium]|nr:HAD-IIIA family hydrolase [Bacteroidales bacterium]
MKYFTNLLQEYITQKGDPLTFIEDACHFFPGTISLLLTRQRVPTWNEIVTLAKYFQVDPIELVLPKKLIGQLRTYSFKWIILDVDGVLTDGGIYISARGVESKRFNVKDGYAIKQLIENNFQIGFLSNAHSSRIVSYRAKMLNVALYYVGEKTKHEVFSEWVEKYNIEHSSVIYVGDDLNDLDLMKKVGFSVCPSDAHPFILEHADMVLFSRGGEGCVAELLIYLKRIMSF